MHRNWCQKVRVLGPQSYRVDFNDELAPTQLRRDILRRTFDTWGRESQDTIARLNFGIVGLWQRGLYCRRSNGSHWGIPSYID